MVGSALIRAAAHRPVTAGTTPVAFSTGFLQKLQTYDKDNISPAIIEKIRPYMDNPDFEPEVVKKASKAAFGLVSWVRAMEAYDR